MPELIFKAPTHAELVLQVREWLESATDTDDSPAVTLVGRSAEIAKDALRIVADAAPQPVAESEVLKRLTDMGYQVTDRTRDTVIAGLGVAAEVTDGSVVRRAQGAGESAFFEMNAQFARKLLSRLVREQ